VAYARLAGARRKVEARKSLCVASGGSTVAFGSVSGAVLSRSRLDDWRARELSWATVPDANRRALPRPRPSGCPELDCIRDMLPRPVIAFAERRAQAIGVGAERVLICADAMTEEAYLSALAASLGTIYEPLNRVSRTDCPLDDHELIQAAAAGLLPLRKGREIIWVIAPRCATARRLADPLQPRPAWLRRFRLTSSEHLRRFVAQHSRSALGRQATDGLRLSRPLMSNAPRAQGWRSIVAIALATFAASLLVNLSAETIGSLSTALCLVFLAASILRMSSGLFASQVPRGSPPRDDGGLPIYTIICALYREADVVGGLVTAIRALDYPGIMAQTPQAP
jgi:glycosyltransferase XagB